MHHKHYIPDSLCKSHLNRKSLSSVDMYHEHYISYVRAICPLGLLLSFRMTSAHYAYTYVIQKLLRYAYNVTDTIVLRHVSD